MAKPHPRKVTAKLLREKGACEHEVIRFARIFPAGLSANQKGLIRALDGGLSRVAWPWSLRLGLEISLEKANLYGADLRGADLSGANLRGTDLSGANLPAGKVNESGFWEVPSE